MMRRLACLALLALSAASACSSSSSSSGTQSGPQQPAQSAAPANPGESEQSKQTPKDPDTQLVVGLDAENFAGSGYQLTSYEIQVNVDGVSAAKESLDATKPNALPHETRLVAPQGKATANVEVIVTGVMNNATVITRRATTRFVQGKTKLAYVFLEVRCNTFPLLGGGDGSGPTCTNANETCIGGKCRSDALGDLEDYRADWAQSPPSACGGGAQSEITIGQGQDALAAINDGDTLSVECGPQGGHHLWLALRMKNLSQWKTTTTISGAVTGTSTTVAPTAYGYAWSPADAGACELLGARFQLDLGGAPIADYLGKPLDITVEAHDAAGRKVTALKHVNISPTRSGPMCR